MPGKPPKRNKRSSSVGSKFQTLTIDDDLNAMAPAAKRNDGKDEEPPPTDPPSSSSPPLSDPHEYLPKSRKSFGYVKEDNTVEDAVKTLCFWGGHLQQELGESFRSIDTHLQDQDARFDALEKATKDHDERLKDTASKHDVVRLQGEVSSLQNTVHLGFADFRSGFKDLMQELREMKNGSASSEAPKLVETEPPKALHKAPEMQSEKAPLNDNFTLQNLQNSHGRLVFPHRQHVPLPPQDARNQDAHHWLRSYADEDHGHNRTNRFNRIDRSRSRPRSIVLEPSKEPPATNPKPTHLQASPTVTAVVKTEPFKPSEVGYFYPGLPEDTHPSGDYVISGKDVFYRDVHMFAQQIRRVAATKEVIGHLHLCLRGSAMIWFTSQSNFTQTKLLHDPEEFCRVLIAKYKISTSKAFDKLQAEHYTVQDARKGRPADDYVQSIIRHGRSCDVVDFAALTYAWKGLDDDLRRDVKRPTKHTTSDEFVEALDEVIEYYGSITRKDTRSTANTTFGNRFDEKEAAFQRGVKATERRLLNQQSPQQYQSIQAPPPQQNRGYQGNRGYMQSGNPPPPRQYPQYPAPPPNQKLLTNQTETRPYTYFAARADGTDTYGTAEEDEAYYSAPADTKYATTDAQFGETVTAFHSQAPFEEDFNDTHTARHGMPPYSCNICEVVYPEDYVGLNNHMFDAHQIDIRSNQSKGRKQYVNWMEHAALNVYEIKSPPNGYATFKAALYNDPAEQTEPTTICADSGSGTSFMDESLLPKGNLFGRLDTVPPVTVRGIAGEKIVDKRMHLPIHVIGAKGVVLEARPYVTKGIKAGVILGNDVLGLPQNKISLHLHNKRMQIGSIQVPIEFTSPKTSPVSFHIASVTAVGTLKSCIKSITECSTQNIKKTVSFAMRISEGKHVDATKSDAPSQSSQTSRKPPARQINGYQMLRFTVPDAEKICFRFAPENGLGKTSEIPEWRRHAAPPTDHRRHPNHTQSMAQHRRRPHQPWR